MDNLFRLPFWRHLRYGGAIMTHINNLLSATDVAMLQPVLGMLLLTLIMCLWMYAMRIPAMQKAKIDPQDAAHVRDVQSLLPSSARRVADNYNHLFEAPTVFYALVFYIILMGNSDPLHVKCAWAYLIFRTLHSIVQASYNKVIHRFVLFMLSTGVMTVMIVREVMQLFIN